MNRRQLLLAAPLTREGFAPFGEIVALDGVEAVGRAINEATSRRFDDLLTLDVGPPPGRARASLVRARAVALPAPIKKLERHPLGSQLFLPLGAARFLIVAARDAANARPGEFAAFVSNGRQGVNYRRGVWHSPLLALDGGADFLVVDRAPEEDNCHEAALDAEFWAQVA